MSAVSLRIGPLITSRKKKVCHHPCFIYITEIDEKGKKVFTVLEDRNFGIK